MQKEKIETVQAIIALQIKKYLKGIAPSKVAAEYGISTSIMSKLVRGLKNPQFTTILQVSEALGISATEFMHSIESNLPEGFSTIEE